jgi:MFS family permease
VFPALSVVLPLVGSYFAQNFGYNIVFIATSMIYLSCALFVSKFGKHIMHYTLEGCKNELKGFKTLLSIEGIYGGGMTANLGLIPLIYFTKPEELGLFLSVSTVFSLVASLLISKVSDRNRKRKKYIGIFGSGLGLSTIIAMIATTAGGWYIFASIRNFFSALFWPFTTSILMDNKRHMEKSMVGREFVLNMGRILGMAIVVGCVIFATIHLSLLFLGAVLMAYPLVIELKKGI